MSHWFESSFFRIYESLLVSVRPVLYHSLLIGKKEKRSKKDIQPLVTTTSVSDERASRYRLAERSEGIGKR